MSEGVGGAAAGTEGAVMGGEPGTGSGLAATQGASDDPGLAAVTAAPFVAGNPETLAALNAKDGDAPDDGSSTGSPAKSLIEQEEETFYSASQDTHGDDNIWGLLSGVVGNIYEWYDFAVYGLLASEIGHAFFPDSSSEMKLIQSYGIHMVSFLMRPIGAIVFGEIGDRIAGRKNALVVSIIMITTPSVCLGLLPTYEMWGNVSPILLLILRLIQGLSVGGQLAGSYVLSIEQSSANNRGFRGSICDASSVGGFVLASGVTALTRRIIPYDYMEAWGWRIPFIISLLIAPILYNIVKQTEESKFWAERNEQKETEQAIRENEAAETTAVMDLMSSPFRRRQLLGMIGVLSAKITGFYTLFLWTPVYLSHLRGLLSEADADLLTFTVVGCYIFLLLIGGKLSDSFPHRMDLIRIGLPGMLVAGPAMFGIFESEAWYGFFIGQLQLAVCLAMVQGGIAAWEVELWMSDPTLSFTGVAVGHNVAASIFGGTLPLIATWLYGRGDALADGDDVTLFPRLLPGLYISFLTIVALFSITFVVRHPHDLRTGEKKLRDVAMNADKKRKKKKKKKKQDKKQMQSVEGYWANPEGGGGPPSEIAHPNGSYVPPAPQP